MKEKTTKTTPSSSVAKEPVAHRSGNLFQEGNIKWMLIGAAVMALGFVLMSGGRSEDPRTFNADEIYSTTRITIAPILILAGLAIEIFAIFRTPRKS